jgi:hypothetical protein
MFALAIALEAVVPMPIGCFCILDVYDNPAEDIIVGRIVQDLPMMFSQREPKFLEAWYS